MEEQLQDKQQQQQESIDQNQEQEDSQTYQISSTQFEDEDSQEVEQIQIKDKKYSIPKISIRKRKSSMEELIPYVGIDIGGTLAKVSLAFKKGAHLEFSHLEHLKIETHENFNVYFEVFPTSDLEQMFKFIEKTQITNFSRKFFVTGGGAHKFKELIEGRLGIEIFQVPEMQSLSYGLKVLDMLLPNDSVYTYDKNNNELKYVKQKNWMFPLILVQCGSGVSILKVENQTQFERVSGTSLGGNVFLGISYLLTKIKNFDEALKVSTSGNNKNTDLFVSDIYKQMQDIPEDLIDSQEDYLCVSFGRVKQKIKNGEKIDKADLIKSALMMVSFNISQIAFLVASIHKIDNIFFTGYFIKNHKDTIKNIHYALEYFSKYYNHNKLPYFLKHDGFLGALGSFYKAYKTEKSDESSPKIRGIYSNDNSVTSPKMKQQQQREHSETSTVSSSRANSTNL